MSSVARLYDFLSPDVDIAETPQSMTPTLLYNDFREQIFFHSENSIDLPPQQNPVQSP